jgi:AcrR family transcriptional regulator
VLDDGHPEGRAEMESVESAGEGQAAPRRRGRPPNPELRAARQERMLQAAMELFIQRGYEQVTIAQIAKAAGRSKGSFYWHFKDKEDCLAQILSLYTMKIEEIVTRETAKGASAAERLHRLIDYRNWRPSEFGQFALLIDSMLFNRSPTVRDLGLSTIKRVWQSTFEILRQLGREAAQEAGWPRERLDAFDFDAWAWCILTCYTGTLEFLNHRYLAYVPQDLHLSRAYHQLFLAPLAAARSEANSQEAAV